MNIKKKIKKHHKTECFARITRQVAKDWDEISRGYIVDHSKDFIVLQETDDFKALGFNILPIKDFKEVRNNSHDKYYDKIMIWENEKKNIGLKTKINLKNWKFIFKDFQEIGMSIIVECENPKINSFTIGEVKKVTNKSVFIRYFDAAGFLDEEPTKLKFKNITKVLFNDRYADVFSKYTRELKSKKP